MNVDSLIKHFYENNKKFTSLIDKHNLKKTKKRLKKYNLEYDIYIEEEISKKFINLINTVTNESIKVACLNNTDEVFFEYSSDEILINEEKVILNVRIPETGIYCDGWTVMFEFNGNDEALELQHKTVCMYGKTTEIMIYQQKMFDLLYAQIEKYDIKILKLLTGDTHYLASIDFNMIFLESDNNILKDFCENKYIFNRLNIDKYLIKKKDFNILERIKLHKKKRVNRKKFCYSPTPL